MSRSIKNNRKRWTLLGAVIGMATTLALVVGLGVFAGSGSAASSAKPGNTNPPSISGTAQENSTLTADNGSWKNGVNKYAYFWTRCDKTGASCANISGAHALKYIVTSADVGNTLRFKVQATNGDGSTTATSVPTAVVVSATKPPPPPPATGCPAGTGAIQIADLSSPAILLLDQQQTSPSVVTGGRSS